MASAKQDQYLSEIWIKALQKTIIFVFFSFAKYETPLVLKVLNVSKLLKHNRIVSLKYIMKKLITVMITEQK